MSYKSFSTGRYLLSIVGMFPQTILTDTLASVRKEIKDSGIGKDSYRIFKVNEDGYIQQINLGGSYVN